MLSPCSVGNSWVSYNKSFAYGSASYFILRSCLVLCGFWESLGQMQKFRFQITSTLGMSLFWKMVWLEILQARHPCLLCGGTRYVIWSFKDVLKRFFKKMLFLSNLFTHTMGLKPTTMRSRVACSIDWASQPPLSKDLFIRNLPGPSANFSQI